MLKKSERLTADNAFMVRFIVTYIIEGVLVYYFFKYNESFTFLWRIFIIFLIFVCLIVGWYFMMQYVFIWSHVVDYDKTAPKLIITKQFIYKGRVIRWCKEGIHIMGKYDLPICIFYDIGYVLNTENDCMKILDKCILKKDHVYFNKNDVNCKWWFYRATYTNVEE